MKKHSIKIRVSILMFMILAASGSVFINVCAARTFYVNQSEGNDNSSGLSETEPWSSLAKVNSIGFLPGDTILFKCGENWKGTLSPMGSGLPHLPIVISKYGEGALPKIDGNGMTDQGVLYFENQSHWVIGNLEITNDAETGGIRRGVEICGRNGGLLSGFHLNNLHVHHIRGLIGNGMLHKSTGGIFFCVYDDEKIPTRFDDLLIESCKIHDCDNQGIVTYGNITYPDPDSPEWNKRKFTNVIIRKNIIYNISKNAMILRMMEGGIVERNLCYSTATGTTGNTIFTRSSRQVILQYNEGYDNQSPKHDGSLYDADMQSVECIFQYSYSHDNAHGLYWQCTEQEDYGNVVRYNISQNDKGRIFNFSFPSKSTLVYNNTVFIGSHRSPVIIGEKSLNGGKRNYTFMNNLVYNESKEASYIWVEDEFIGKRDFSNNLFYGCHPEGEPDDPNKLTGDPKLLKPGSAVNMEDLLGYQLRKGSPAIGKGAVIQDNGGIDIFGRPVTYPPDIGAIQYTTPIVLSNTQAHPVLSDISLDKNGNILQLKLPEAISFRGKIELTNLQGRVLYSHLPAIESEADRVVELKPEAPLQRGIYFVQCIQANEILESRALVIL